MRALVTICKKLAVWKAAVFSFYTVLGLFLLPPIVRVVAVAAQCSSDTGG